MRRKGDFFVNKDCIGCESCVDIAPEHFNTKHMMAYVTKQPTNQKERAQCIKAKKECPVEAIKRKMK